MKIGLIDTAEVLAEQMGYMSDRELSPEDFKKEIQRSNALAKLSASAINNADLALRVQQAYGGDLDVDAKVPEMLRVERPEIPNVAGKAR